MSFNTFGHLFRFTSFGKATGPLSAVLSMAARHVFRLTRRIFSASWIAGVQGNRVSPPSGRSRMR